eukprot:gene636-886_t
MRADKLQESRHPDPARASSEPAWSRAEFEAQLRERGKSYHIHHPFNVMLNTGKATPEQVRGYLAATLDVTLDILAGTPEDDAALHFFRQSLLHEDRLCEAWDEARRLGQPASRPQRQALWMPAQTWALGSTPGGYVPLLERWAHPVDVPAFEIDAQPVNWAQYMEFAEDGGYDRAECWSAEGWAWVRAEGRRAPAHVEQLRGAV